MVLQSLHSLLGLLGIHTICMKGAPPPLYSLIPPPSLSPKSLLQFPTNYGHLLFIVSTYSHFSKFQHTHTHTTPHTSPLLFPTPFTPTPTPTPTNYLTPTPTTPLFFKLLFTYYGPTVVTLLTGSIIYTYNLYERGSAPPLFSNQTPN
jgi:hypothetical protein